MTRNVRARPRRSASQPDRRPILIATKGMLFRGQDIRLKGPAPAPWSFGYWIRPSRRWRELRARVFYLSRSTCKQSVGGAAGKGSPELDRYSPASLAGSKEHWSEYSLGTPETAEIWSYQTAYLARSRGSSGRRANPRCARPGRPTATVRPVYRYSSSAQDIKKQFTCKYEVTGLPLLN